MHEAKRSGNSPHDPQADWIDYTAAGIEEPEQRVTSLVAHAGAGAAGWRRLRPGPAQRHPDRRPRRAQGTAARGAAGDAASGWATSADLSRLVEPFDPERYNTNASLAENLLFGSPVGPVFDPEQIADQPYVRETLAARPVCSATSTRSATASPRRCSSCSPTCRPTTSISASSASSRPRTCRPIAAC